MKAEDYYCMGCMEKRANGATCPDCGYKHGSAPESPLYLPPGTRLKGKYLIGRVLGHGGFGITYLAFDLELQVKLAIKEYLPRGMAIRSHNDMTVTPYTGPSKEHFSYGLNKFLEEARALAKFEDSPGIVSVRDFFRANGTACFVMNFVEGITFKKYLENKGGKIPFDQAVNILMPVMDALREVHGAKLLHRDISPDNIYITRDGRVKLLDFGAARYATGEHSRSLSVMLKPGYAPEEQYRSKGQQGAWTDVYALAATLYRVVTGQVPLEAPDRLHEDTLEPLSKLGISIPAEKEAALMKALAIRAEDRFQSIENFQQALMEELPTSPTPGPTVPELSKGIWRTIIENWKRTERWKKIFSCAILAVLLLLMVISVGIIPLVPGRLYVDVDPSDAQIRISETDSEFVQGIKLKQGSYTVEVSAEGYITKTDDIWISAGKDKHVPFTLSQSSKLNPIGLSDPISNSNIDPTQLESLSKKYGWEKNITRDYSWPKSTLKPSGFLSIKVTPSDASISISRMTWSVSGLTYQKIPLIRSTFNFLSTGNYRLTASKEGYVEKTVPFVIKSGETTRLNINLTKEATKNKSNSSSDSGTKAPSHGDHFTNSLGMEFVYIGPGSFMMGSPEDEKGREDDEKQHKVTLTQGYWLQTTEVTQAQWKAVMGENPSKFKGDDLPVETVSWEDAQAFIKKLNQREDEITYSLPTEAQWEYAARAGTTGPFAFGSCLSTDQANYDGNHPLSDCSKGKHRETTVAVGSFSPNDWGLYDMHGNVIEWCQDWYGDYTAGSVTDPTGPSTGSNRVYHGGSWNDRAKYCRSANRFGCRPDIRNVNNGFRLAVAPSR